MAAARRAPRRRTSSPAAPERTTIDGTLRDELLNGTIIYSLNGEGIVIEYGHREYNEPRPHSAPGYRPLALAACSHKRLILAQLQMLQ